MLFLYESIADGIHWNELLEPLYKHCSPWWSVAFILYMSFVLFSLLNIVTAFFIESVMSSAQERHNDDVLWELQKMLNLVDDNRDRYVSKEEIDKHMNDPSIKASL